MSNQQTVLVIDDEEAIRRNLGASLEDLGYRVVVAADGAQGLKAVERERPDIVLTDLRMPVMDGLEFLSTLRETTPDLPVIVVSGTGAIREAIDAIRRGAWDYILKPIQEQEELEVVIRRALERVRLLAENRRYQSHLEELVCERTAQLHQLNEHLEQRITERTAQLEQANRQLEAFSYSVSHDLRAPIRHIRGFSQILHEDCWDRLDDNGRQCLSRIIVGCERMGCLIDDLLNFSHSSRHRVEKSAVQTGALVRDVLAELMLEQKGRQIDLVMGELSDCQADPTLLRQVYVNLIGNAMKYSSQRENPRIEVGSFTKNGGTVYFVKDNGAGFDMAHAGRLFGVFQRLHGQEEFPGTGVGLAIVENIIRRHGGKIWAEAAVDAGATFFFTLDAHPAD